MSEFNSLLIDISKEIITTELETMKYFCEEYKIGAKRLEEITEAYQLFRELKKRDLLGPEKTDVLVMLLEKAGRIDLKNQLLGIQGSCNVVSESRAPGAPAVNCAFLNDSHLSEIAEELGKDWKHVGRKLGVSNNKLESIDADFRRVREKAFQTLSAWKKQNGNDATGQVLANALTASRRKDVAELLATMCTQDGLNIHTSDERPGNLPVPESNETASGGLNTMQADLGQNLPTQESGDT